MTPPKPTVMDNLAFEILDDVGGGGDAVDVAGLEGTTRRQSRVGRYGYL